MSCAGQTLTTERILRMTPGLRGQDISVLERRTRSASKEDKNGTCGTTDRAETPRTILLPFDGERYVAPDLSSETNPLRRPQGRDAGRERLLTSPSLCQAP
ncbi:hypothetical protein D3C86_1891850 [compost metagenome]